MLRKLALTLIFVGMSATSALAADWWVVPYGSFGMYRDLTSAKDLTIRNPAIEQPEIAVSQLSDGVGGGLTIAGDFEGIGGILGFNVEYMTTSEDMTFDEIDPALGPSELHIDSPAMAIGGFFAGELPWMTSGSFKGYGGLEMGVLKSGGTVKINYVEAVPDEENPGSFLYVAREESADLSKMSLYMTVFWTEEFNFGSRFGLSGTVGYRLVTDRIERITTDSMSGHYGQEFSGLTARLGLKVDI